MSQFKRFKINYMDGTYEKPPPVIAGYSKCQSRVDDEYTSVLIYYDQKIAELEEQLNQEIMALNIAAIIDLKNRITKLKKEKDDALQEAKKRMYRMMGYAREAGQLQELTFSNYIGIFNENANLDETTNLLKKTHTTDKEDSLYTQISIADIQIVNIALTILYYFLVLFFWLVLYQYNTTFSFEMKIFLSIFIVFVPMLRDIFLSIWTYFYNIYNNRA
jgi:hypothetical protein